MSEKNEKRTISMNNKIQQVLEMELKIKKLKVAQERLLKQIAVDKDIIENGQKDQNQLKPNLTEEVRNAIIERSQAFKPKEQDLEELY